MFVKKLPEFSNSCPAQLREVRDGESMLIVAHKILAAVDAMAGSEPAEVLRERMVSMLPANLTI